MKLPISGRRRWAALTGVGMVATAGLIAIPTIAHAAPACEVVYTSNDWQGGFTGNVVVKNTGDAISNWTLTFPFTAGQTVQQGWSANWSQSGANVTATSMSWNGALGTGASTNIGFNGSWTGSNPKPTAFKLNGTTCNGTTPGNQAPTVSLTSPTNGSSYASGVAVPLAATAADPDGSISKVEFKVDGVLVNTDTTAPFAFSATGLAVGSHSATATAYDNGTPALTATSTAANFTVTGTQTPTISITPSSLSVNEGSSGTAVVKLSSAPAANVTVALARTGDTSITAPASVTLTPANAVAGVSITVAAAEDADQVHGTASFAATASGYTGASLAVTEIDNDVVIIGKVDNPYLGARGYVNSEWKAKAESVPGGSRVSNTPTAVWLDRIAAIEGTENSQSNGSMGLEDHLDAALAQYNAGSGPLTVQFMIYNLPGRDCSALASNGELGVDELPRYKAEYIDPIAAIQALPKYAPLRIINIIETDSIPNLVTNLNFAKCATVNSNGAYVNGIGYALAKLGAIGNVYNYIDAAHHGWIGWDTNFSPTAVKLKQAATASGSTVNNVHGFIVNTANTSALREPFFGINTTVGGTSVRQSTWVDWNFYVDELSFAQAFRNRLVTEGFNSNIGMLIDTSRNGWGGTARPTAASTSTDLNTFVNASRVDRKIHAGNWCNQSGAGLGERPTAAPEPGIDAYVWAKPPGESDGSSSLIPNNDGKGFDRMCDPTYTGNSLNGNNMTGALPNAPISGAWFAAQFAELMQNAYPPLP